MNWKKALLVTGVLVFAFVFLVLASLGVAIGAGVAGVVAAVENGVVEAVVESAADVAEEAERLDIEVNIPRVTITDPESGRSRVIIPGREIPRGRFIVRTSGHTEFWRPVFLAPLHFIARAMTSLLAAGLIVTGAWLLLRNRQPVEKQPKAT